MGPIAAVRERSMENVGASRLQAHSREPLRRLDGEERDNRVSGFRVPTLVARAPRNVGTPGPRSVEIKVTSSFVQGRKDEKPHDPSIS